MRRTTGDGGDGEGERKRGRVMDINKEMGMECEGCERCGESKRLMRRADGQRRRRCFRLRGEGGCEGRVEQNINVISSGVK